jgi:hypothetical protein
LRSCGHQRALKFLLIVHAIVFCRGHVLFSETANSGADPIDGSVVD